MFEDSFVFDGEEYITRAELVKRAQAEGLEVTERTVRYWATYNMFPRPFRLDVDGHRKTAFYPVSLMPRLRAMIATRPRVIKKVRDELMEGGLKIVRIGSHQFQVLPSMLEFEEDGYKCTLYKLADGSGDELLLVRHNPSSQE